MFVKTRVSYRIVSWMAHLKNRIGRMYSLVIHAVIVSAGIVPEWFIVQKYLRSNAGDRKTS